MLRIATLVFAGAALAAAQITGPVSALVFDDSTRTLRFVLGIPGASHFGPAIAEGLEASAVSPDTRRALGVREGRVVAFRQDNGALTETTLLEGSAESFAWDATSRYAAFRMGARVFRYDANSDAVTELGDAAGARLLAVDRSGVVYAVAGGSVSRLTSSELRQIASVADPVDAALSLDGLSLYVADAATRAVLRVDTAAGGAQTFAAEAGAAGVALSEDGRTVLVADKDGRKVRSYSASTQELLGTLELAFEPTLLDPIGSGLYALTRREKGGPLEVLAVRDGAAAYFIPAVEGN